MQAKKSGLRRDRLVEALNRASRESSGLGVLFGEAVARRFGVNHTDFECIDIILLRGRVTAGELAEASGLTTGAVTGVIDRLERAGYVRRQRDRLDRRKVYVKILPRTLALGASYYGSFERAVNTLLDTYTDDEIALLVDFFTRSKDVILREIEDLKRRPEGGRRPARPRRKKPARSLRP